MFKALWATRNFSKKRFSLRLRYISNNSVRYNKRESARSPNPLASVWRIALSLKNSYVKMISYPRIIRIQCIMCILLKAYDRDKKKREREMWNRSRKKVGNWNKEKYVHVQQAKWFQSFHFANASKCSFYECWHVQMFPFLLLTFVSCLCIYMLFHSSYPIAREMKREFCIEAAFTMKQRTLRICCERV